MRHLLLRRIDPSEPMYDGQERMNAAMAVLTGASNKQVGTPTVQKSRAPIAPATSSRHHRGFRRDDAPGLQVARRALRPDRRIAGGTRYYQPSSRIGDQFRSNAAAPAKQANRNLRYSSALLMAGSSFNRRPVMNRAQVLDGIRSRALAQNTVNTLRHRWNVVNRTDLSDGIVHSHHLRRHARNSNSRDHRVNPAVVAMLVFG